MISHKIVGFNPYYELDEITRIHKGSQPCAAPRTTLWHVGRHASDVSVNWALGKKNNKNIRGRAPNITKLVYNSNNYGLWYL